MNVFLFLLLFLRGVFGDEVKSVSVMEGQSVTLHTDTELQTDDEILWLFGPKGTLIAEINRKDNKINIYNVDLDERFRDRLQVDHQTGSLTITNISTQHTGLYQVQIINSRKPSYKRFNVTVNGFCAAAAETDVMKTITDEEQEESFIRLDIEVTDPPTQMNTMDLVP